MTGRPPTPEHIALTCSRCGAFVAWAFPPAPPVAVVGACCAVEPVCVCPPGADLETCLDVACSACDSIPVTQPCARAAEDYARAEEPWPGRDSTGRPLPPEQGPGDYAPAIKLPAPAYLAQERGEAP